MKSVLEDPEEGGVLSLKEVKAINPACCGTLRTPTLQAGPSSIIPHIAQSPEPVNKHLKACLAWGKGS